MRAIAVVAASTANAQRTGRAGANAIGNVILEFLFSAGRATLALRPTAGPFAVSGSNAALA
jgi:hypothetical protein